MIRIRQISSLRWWISLGFGRQTSCLTWHNTPPLPHSGWKCSVGGKVKVTFISCVLIDKHVGYDGTCPPILWWNLIFNAVVPQPLGGNWLQRWSLVKGLVPGVTDWRVPHSVCHMKKTQRDRHLQTRQESLTKHWICRHLDLRFCCLQNGEK